MSNQNGDFYPIYKRRYANSLRAIRKPLPVSDGRSGIAAVSLTNPA
jgi:hypothetical protein